MRPRRGSAARAWVVAHDGVGVGVLIAVVGVAASVYAFVQVPGPHGGPIPMWLLTPPVLAMVAALAVHNEIPAVGWSEARLRRARLLWAVTAIGWTALAAQLVGWHAGQGRMGALAAVLTGLTFGLSVAIGRGSLVLGATILLVIVVNTNEVHSLTPAAVWDDVTGPARVAVVALVAGGVAAYAWLGSRMSRASLTG